MTREELLRDAEEARSLGDADLELAILEKLDAMPQEQQSQSWSEVGKQAISNIPKSAENLATGLVQSVFHPIDTTQAMLDAANGGLQNLLPDSVNQYMHKEFPETVGNVDKANAIGQFYADRYGSMGGFKNAVANDPVGVGLDVAPLIGGAAGVLSRTKLARPLVRRIAPESAEVAGANAALKTEQAMTKALAETGLKNAPVPQSQLQAIKDQILEASKKGKDLDAAALLRQKDFEALNIKPLQGQLTRDPIQFAQEQNLRGAIPEITGALREQGQKLRGLLSSYSDNAANNYDAGNSLISTLKAHDEGLRSNVSDLYTAARNSAGKDLDVPLQGLAQDYAQTLYDFGDKIPSGVRRNFEDYGLLTGQQLKRFTVQDADRLLKVINDNVGSDNATNNALSRLRNSLKNSVANSAPDGGVYAPAVKAAAQRFKLQDDVPALKAVSEDAVYPDNFIDKFIIKGKTDEVKRMAAILDPDSFNQAKAQIGAHLERAALGENLSGDAPFSPERFAKALRSIGDEKLRAFYNEQEIDNFNRIARVGQYINKAPDTSAVNRSNTTVSALMNAPYIKGLLNIIPGGSTAGAVGKAAAQAVGNQRAATRALNPIIPMTEAELSVAQKELLRSGLKYGLLGEAGSLLNANQQRR